MKKKLLSLLGVACFSLILGVVGCNKKTTPTNPSSQVATTYTVAFDVDGTRYKTLKVKDGEKITETVANPSKDGYIFTGWYEDTTLVDLAEYVVTHNVTFNAKFELDEGDVLSVDDKKQAGQTYYMVFGWWEVNDPEEPNKVTSGLTKTSVRRFYANMIKYLKAVGATDEQIGKIQFRNYSSKLVADMGTAINGDGDVDILIGVGPNITTGAGVQTYDKFQTPMGDGPTSRYVACTSVASDLGKSTYEWIKNTDAGKASLLRELTDTEIQESLAPVTINLTVRVHGDTTTTTVIDDVNDVIEMPTITDPSGKVFDGFALVENATTPVLRVEKDAVLKYNDVKSFVATDATTLDLYPVFAVIDLMVYAQTGSNLTEAEAKLLEGRFNQTLTSQRIKIKTIEGDAATFTEKIGTDADVAVGGNNPLKNFQLYDNDNYPLDVAGAKHFKDTGRRIVILKTINAEHVALAVSFYNFVKAAAPVFDVYSAVWTKDGDWVTANDKANYEAGIQTKLELYMGVAAGALSTTYNVTISYQDVTTTGNKVADLGAATRALRDNVGPDLIIGCGGNVDSTGGMTVVLKKNVALNQLSKDRYVALIRDNALTRVAYDYFNEK